MEIQNGVELICGGCEKPFFKSKKEHERQLRKGKSRFFCSLSCQVRRRNLDRSGKTEPISEWSKAVILTCSRPECGASFQRARKEYDRLIKKGQKNFYCSGSCQVRNEHSINPRRPRPENLRRGSIVDALAPFRWFLLRVKSRSNQTSDITLQYLNQIWNDQSGKCPFSGWKMTLPRDSRGFKSTRPENASLDRIDNSLGYMQGNVRFICLISNLARSTFSDEDVRAFGKSIHINCSMRYE